MKRKEKSCIDCSLLDSTVFHDPRVYVGDICQNKDLPKAKKVPNFREFLLAMFIVLKCGTPTMLIQIRDPS